MKEITISLTLTVEEGNKVLAGLGHLPFRDCANLIAKVKQQADEQVLAALSQAEQAPAEVE